MFWTLTLPRKGLLSVGKLALCCNVRFFQCALLGTGPLRLETAFSRLLCKQLQHLLSLFIVVILYTCFPSLLPSDFLNGTHGPRQAMQPTGLNTNWVKRTSWFSSRASVCCESLHFSMPLFLAVERMMLYHFESTFEISWWKVLCKN